jgi:hypothetical protein
VKKRIVIPVYKDRRNTKGWEKKYQQDPERFSVCIYEKDDTLISGQEIRTPEGFRIPNVGRSSATYLYHICKHYDELWDVEIFAKTHVTRTWTKIHESIADCHLYKHLEFWNTLRAFIWTSQETYNLLKDHWDLHCASKPVIAPGDANPHTWCSNAPWSELGLAKYDIPACTYRFDPMDKLLVVPSCGWEHRPALPRLLSIFPDYKLPDIYIGRQERIHSVRKEVIKYHPKDLYTNMLESLETGGGWNLDQDTWCLFWPLFWDETIRRMEMTK